MPIPIGLTKDHVLRALSDLDAGIAHPWGPSTGYDLVYNGKTYDPKAAIGVAGQYAIGRMLRLDEFSGGEAPGQANFVLRQLGFTVVKKGDREEPKTGQDWSRSEVRLIVADYFDMLEAEMLDRPYKKSEYRKALAAKLAGRSKGSIEFKHQNVSGVLVDLGLPYIEGYKPRGNYQSLLGAEVEAFLDQNPDFLRSLAESSLLNPTRPSLVSEPNLEEIIEEPPDKITAPVFTGKPWLSRKGRKIDFAARDAANRQLGRLGEQFVYDLERYRLNSAGRDDLAQKVEWVSESLGDGLGFDILSFDEADESERKVEVKTTGLGKFFPFYVTAIEVRCSEDIPRQFHLFRVFDFGRRPRLYVLQGALSESCQLEPLSFRATIDSAR